MVMDSSLVSSEYTFSEDSLSEDSTFTTIDQEVEIDDIPVNTLEDFYEAGWQLLEKEKLGKLQLNMPLDKVIELLGEPDEKEEMVEWGADGEYHQQYIYKSYGIELNIVGEKEPDRKLFIIDAFSTCPFKTKKGIGMGSSYDDVMNAYQSYIEPSFSGPTTLTAGTIYGGVIFMLEDSKVNRIFMGAAAD